MLNMYISRSKQKEIFDYVAPVTARFEGNCCHAFILSTIQSDSQAGETYGHLSFFLTFQPFDLMTPLTAATSHPSNRLRSRLTPRCCKQCSLLNGNKITFYERRMHRKIAMLRDGQSRKQRIHLGVFSYLYFYVNFIFILYSFSCTTGLITQGRVLKFEDKAVGAKIIPSYLKLPC